MAEIAFNQAYENLTDAQKREFDGVMGMGGFNERYQANPTGNLVTGDKDYELFAPISKAYQESETIPKGNFLSNMFNFGKADAAMPDQTYGLQTNTMGGVTINPDGTLNYNNQSPNLGFRSMVDMAADTENFDNQFNNNFADYNMSGPLRGTNTMRGSVIGPDMSIRDYQQAANKSDMIGNTISEAMIEEDSIPQNFRTRMNNPFFERPTLSNASNLANYFNQGLGGVKGIKEKMGQGWDFAKQIPGMAMGALSGIPGIGIAMGLLRNMARPDNPYQKFQKQTFSDMGYQGDPNKDPWGKNIRSIKDTYDVRDQWSDLMGTKIGQNYGYEQAFADGVITDAEIEAMMGEGLAGGDYKGTGKFKGGLKGWQLNRAIGLSDAAKKAQAWQDKKAQEKIITNQMKNIDTGGKTKTYTPTGNYGKKTFHPSQGNTGGGGWSPAGKSPSSSGYSRGSYGGRGHHWARGGRVGYANGGLATLFTRRG